MVKKIFAVSYIWILLLVMYIPIFVLVALSFTTSKAFGDWSGFSFDLYRELFENEAIWRALKNTFVIAGASSLVATILGTVTAVGMYSMKRLPKSLLNGASQITVLNADIVTAVAFLLFFVTIGIPAGYATLLIAHIAICTPYVILNVMPRLTQLDPNLYEAALDLGASPVTALRKVMLPQLVPGMVSGFILAFTLSIDDFVITNYNNGELETLTTFIYKDAARAGMTPSLRALSTLIFVVVFAALLILNLRKVRRTVKEER